MLKFVDFVILQKPLAENVNKIYWYNIWVKGLSCNMSVTCILQTKMKSIMFIKIRVFKNRTGAIRTVVLHTGNKNWKQLRVNIDIVLLTERVTILFMGPLMYKFLQFEPEISVVQWS